MMSDTAENHLGFSVRMNIDFETALVQTVDALKAEGFGVLSEIDVKDTFKKKLDIDFPRYKILGACNPPLAYRAFTAAPEVGLLLPCNVTVRQVTDSMVEVAIIDPLIMLGVIQNPALKPIADEARSRLERVAQSLNRVKVN